MKWIGWMGRGGLEWSTLLSGSCVTCGLCLFLLIDRPCGVCMALLGGQRAGGQEGRKGFVCARKTKRG